MWRAKEAVLLWFKMALKLTGALGLIILLAFGADWILRAQNFPVRQVRFEGPFQHVSHAEIERAVLPRVRGNFFLVDLDAVKQAVEAAPWVYRASVRRRFPRDVHINFTEQVLVAHWKQLHWVNQAGEIVRLKRGDVPLDLPIFDGPDGTSMQVLNHHGQFQGVLKPLGLTIHRLSLTPRRSWRLELDVAGADNDQRLVLILDREQWQKKIERFARVYGETLARDLSAIRQVDLRYANGFSVEWRRPAATAAGKERNGSGRPIATNLRGPGTSVAVERAPANEG